MVSAVQKEDPTRKPASVGSVDARLSVWGQASRDAAQRRAEVLVEGALLYAEKVGRSGGALPAIEVDAAAALLDTEIAPLVELAQTLLPTAITQSCRLLWVDPDRLRERLTEALNAPVEAARAEVRRRQALYRRRARLWQNDPIRLNRLRDEIEAMRVPRTAPGGPERVARGLFEVHCGLPIDSSPALIEPELRVKPGTLARWIAQMDERIEAT
ncbi:MAG: hypothetical protein U1E65_28345 [Myxococcota bacterium]